MDAPSPRPGFSVAKKVDSKVVSTKPNLSQSIVAELDLRPPFSPWLRLAHRCDYQGGQRVQARQRVLKDWEFILQVEGDTWLHLPVLGGSVPFAAGNLALIPPGLLHAQAPERGHHLAVHFDFHAQTDLVAQEMVVTQATSVVRADVAKVPVLRLHLGQQERLAPLIVRLPDPATWQRRFAPLLAQWTLRTLDRPSERLHAAGVLAAACADWLALTAAPAPASFTEVLEKIDVCDRRLRIGDLARQARMGETTFRAALTAATGRSPRAWLEERRFENARRLLQETAMPVAAVATACGYDDPFHFSRVCRRLTGKSPRGLRSH